MKQALLLAICLLLLATAGCTHSLTAQGRIVHVVKARAAVANCRFLGRVVVSGPVYTAMGGFAGAAGDRAIERKNETARLGGDTLLRSGGDEDEAYFCGGTSANRAGYGNADSGKSGMVEPEKAPILVRLFDQTDAIAGCRFIGPVDASIECPEKYNDSKNGCTFYRASRMGGNAVHFFTGLFNVYRCPEPPSR